MNDSVPQSETEAYGLLRTAYFDSGEPDEPPSDDTGGEPVHGEPDEDSEFRKKLRDAETPLYLTCSKHTKVSAIMALYRIKVKSGMSEAYFDQLLSALHDMLPEGSNMRSWKPAQDVVLLDGKLISTVMKKRKEFLQRSYGIFRSKTDSRGCLDQQGWLRICDGMPTMPLKMV
ncbi:uncharacterized protein LOC125594709 [Brassica napus]|uniref:uncharacterized protein LOC125594709 n=1 Tax=Brassica napus TaxID=3708 RepID=UPI002078A742|nr:uncharacterized protein LOC125594709 [Brassica napus]